MKLRLQFTQAHQNRTVEEDWKKNATASIVADNIHPCMTAVYPFSDGNLQHDNANWFVEDENEFTVLQWPPSSPDLNPIEYLRDVLEREICIIVVQLTNLQQLCDDIMSLWTTIYDTLLNLLHEEGKRYPTRYLQGVPYKVHSRKFT